ncbi:YdcF family protein [Echinicola marina]|uniref:YdcF family protein n=1 Tax=Echinicola marina TaxID=2859768 RepID=UPI001CF6AD21|nr:YdcF family protein [Echinicola marina]UCS93976.1 YdcF family protein [Echinicola marina]
MTWFWWTKIFTAMLSPLLWSIAILTVGLRVRKKSTWPIVLAGLILCVFSNPWLFIQVESHWSAKLDTSEWGMPATQGKPIVLLGGMTAIDPDGNLVFQRSSDRLWQALEGYDPEEGPVLLISGGAADGPGEAGLIRDYLTRRGWEGNCLFTETTSTTTYENALFSRALFEVQGWSKDIVLLSSGFHLPRAIRCFEKQGFQVTPIATDPLYFKGSRPMVMKWLPDAEVVMGWHALLKEWAGLAIYQVRGYL